jgi:Ala-tRNA(Pro) deacylase
MMDQVMSIDHLPTKPEELLAQLSDLGIDSETIDHPPVYTVEEARQWRGNLPGSHIKNLFLRNKKEEMWLLVVVEDKRVDLKKMGEVLGAGKLSFGSPERLMKHLGVLPGAVTPFSVINDKEGKVNAHPLVNHKTTNLAFQDLVRFLEKTGHRPTFIEL